MDGRGRALDNVFIERLWRSVKYECIYLRDFDTVSSLRAALEEYLDYYNNIRLHQSLSYKVPREIHCGE
jgi:putative transposase